MRVGIDLGGTKIEGIAIDAAGVERLRLRVPTPAGNYPAIIRAIVALVAKIETKMGSAGTVGVGIPGTISPASGLVKNANSTSLIGQPFDKDLENALGRPVRVANDANCFALSEAADGAAAEASANGNSQVVFGVIVGTGTGGGVIVNRAVLTGPNGIAGEWGHNPLPWITDEDRPFPQCYCGKRACLETYLSGPGLAREHARRTGEKLEAAEVAARAERGDAEAGHTIARYEDRLARGLASVINVLDPDVVVLGGGLSNMARLYANVPALWGRYVFSDSVRTRMVRAKHGDSSGVRGAAWLWPA